MTKGFKPILKIISLPFPTSMEFKEGPYSCLLSNSYKLVNNISQWHTGYAKQLELMDTVNINPMEFQTIVVMTLSSGSGATQMWLISANIRWNSSSVFTYIQSQWIKFWSHVKLLGLLYFWGISSKMACHKVKKCPLVWRVHMPNTVVSIMDVVFLRWREKGPFRLLPAKTSYCDVWGCVGAHGMNNLHIYSVYMHNWHWQVIQILKQLLLPSRQCLFQGYPFLLQQDDTKPHSA